MRTIMRMLVYHAYNYDSMHIIITKTYTRYCAIDYDIIRICMHIIMHIIMINAYDYASYYAYDYDMHMTLPNIIILCIILSILL